MKKKIKKGIRRRTKRKFKLLTCSKVRDKLATPLAMLALGLAIGYFLTL